MMAGSDCFGAKEVPQRCCNGSTEAGYLVKLGTWRDCWIPLFVFRRGALQPHSSFFFYHKKIAFSWCLEVHGFLVFCKTWKIVHTWWTKKPIFFTSNVATDLNFKNYVDIHIKMGQSLPVRYICEDMPKCATCLQFEQIEEWNHKLWSTDYKGSQGVLLLRMQQWKPMVKERIKRSLLKFQSRNDPIFNINTWN
jgi:hypothetical protein